MQAQGVEPSFMSYHTIMLFAYSFVFLCAELVQATAKASIHAFSRRNLLLKKDTVRTGRVNSVFSYFVELVNV